jgi:hypothetical protein
MPDMIEVLAEVGLRPPVGVSSEQWCREVAEEIRQNYGLDAELLRLVRQLTGCEYADFAGRAAVQHALTRMSATVQEWKAQIEPLRAELAAYRALAADVPKSLYPASVERPGAKELGAMIRRWNDLLLKSLDGCYCDDGRGDPECKQCTDIRGALGVPA